MISRLNLKIKNRKISLLNTINNSALLLYLLLLFLISFIIRGAEYPSIWDLLFCGSERTTLRVLLTLFMNNTLGRQRTKAPLAALTTSSYELVFDWSRTRLTPSASWWWRLSSMQNLRGCMSRPVQINEGRHWLIGYRFKFRPIFWQSIILGSYISAISQKTVIRFSTYS